MLQAEPQAPCRGRSPRRARAGASTDAGLPPAPAAVAPTHVER